MKCTSSLHLVMLLALAAPVLPAWAINVCTDASGKTVYQDQPCQSVPPGAGNEPIAAKMLTPAVVRDTVKRFNAALTARDVTTASRFLAPKFKATIEDAKGVEYYSRDAFLRMMADVLNAATLYEAFPHCGEVQIRPDGGSVQCELNERVVLLKRKQSGSSTESYRVVLNGGQAQLLTIVSKKH